MIESLLRPRRPFPGAHTWHAVPRSRDTALCDLRPRAGEEWTDPGEAVTCPRCQRIAEALARVVAAGNAAYDPRLQFKGRHLGSETRRLIQLRRLGLVRPAGHLWSLSNEGLLDQATRGKQ